MIGMIRVLTWIPPGDVHFAGGQVDDHGRDRALPVERIDAVNIVITDRVRQIDMILLDRLQAS